LVVADFDVVVKFVLGTLISIDAFLDEDWLYSCEPEHDPGGEKTVYHGDYNLN